MSDEPKPPLSFSRKVLYAALTLVSPRRVASAAADELRNPKIEPEMLRRVKAIRRGFLQSVAWMLATAVLGYCFGRAAFRLFGPNDFAVLALATAGGLVLLWATMAVQGWNIQSMEGNTLPERINQWIYRSLTLLGTLLAVMSGSWAIGP
ncbi:MAG TPA: hypothetical protein VNS34_27025 [Rhizobiaceae bacterium]|nr:hypothetical protein [Rhizobiaceae bacterium]